MITIQAKTIADAHNQVVNLLNENGLVTGTEDMELTKDLFQPTCIHVDYPHHNPKVSEYSLFGEKFVNQYKSALYTLTPRKNDGYDAVYTYGNRLCDYPTMREKFHAHEKRCKFTKCIDTILAKFGYFPDGVSNTVEPVGDGNGGGINQIYESVINRLISSPATRRAEAITWVPQLDMESSEPPCLQLVWFRITPDNRLCTVAVFRSNDMLSASGQNLVAIGALQEFVLDKINAAYAHMERDPLTMGWMECVSLSPHMYFKRDAVELKRFVEKITTKGLI